MENCHKVLWMDYCQGETSVMPFLITAVCAALILAAALYISRGK